MTGSARERAAAWVIGFFLWTVSDAFVPRLPARSVLSSPSALRSSSEPGDSTELARRTLDKAPVVICPAQFGTAKDYEEMIAELEARGHPAIALDLGRFDWLKITRSVLTPDYWQGTLKPVGSLDFYLDAIKEAVDEAKARYPQRKIHLVAHSIGGWIARAYLGEVCSPEERQSFVSLTTLGSPHLPPEGEFWSNIDQTRGLLSYVTERFPGAYHPEIKYICVCGTSTPGDLVGGIEESVAYVSYLPLCGQGESMGDGIVPESIAFLEGAVQVRLPGVKHASFIPTAGPSIRLPNYVWYGSGPIVDKWLVHLPEA